MKKINFNDYAIKLSAGSHMSPKQGMCVMECVAYIAGEQHSDKPRCADGSLTKFAIFLNDYAPSDEHRQRLLAFVPRLAGSKGKVDARLTYAIYLLNEKMRYPTYIFDDGLPREAPWAKLNAQWEKSFAAFESLLPMETEYSAPIVAERNDQKAKELELITSK